MDTTPEEGGLSLDEAVSQAISSFDGESEQHDVATEQETASNDAPDSEVADNPRPNADADGETEPEPQKQEGDDGADADDSEESFTKLNPNELPDELKPLYKSLQADYTRKRQRDAERVKELEKQLEELKGSAKDEETAEPEEKSPEDVVRQAVKSELQAIREEEWGKQAVEDVLAKHPELDYDSPDFDPVASRFVLTALDEALSEYAEKHGTIVGFDYNAELDSAYKLLNERLESYAKAKLEAERKKAIKMAKTLGRRNPTSAGTSASVSESYDDLDSAAQAALSEMGH